MEMKQGPHELYVAKVLQRALRTVKGDEEGDLEKALNDISNSVIGLTIYKNLDGVTWESLHEAVQKQVAEIMIEMDAEIDKIIKTHGKG